MPQVRKKWNTILLNSMYSTWNMNRAYQQKNDVVNFKIVLDLNKWQMPWVQDMHIDFEVIVLGICKLEQRKFKY